MRTNRKKKAKSKQTRRPGLAPGTLVFTGEKKIANANVLMLQFREDKLIENFQKDAIPPPQQEALVTWYDVKGLHNVQLIEKLGLQYNVHPLVLEDILDTQQRPKFEEYENGIFITLRAFTFDQETQEITAEHIAIYAGEDFVLSFQELADDTFAPVRERIRISNGRIRKRGSDYLAYALVDSVVDHYFLVLDQIQETIEQLEDEVLNNPDRQSKERIHQLKLQVLQVRKYMLPLREAVNWFVKSDCPIIQESTELFVRDLYDHILQIIDMLDTYRDIMNGLYDLYLSEISYRTNSVMQLLTIISTIFIPLTFLVGVYGMNFKYMPELDWRYGYFFVWGLMVIMATIMLFIFRKKKWL